MKNYPKNIELAMNLLFEERSKILDKVLPRKGESSYGMLLMKSHVEEAQKTEVAVEELTNFLKDKYVSLVSISNQKEEAKTEVLIENNEEVRNSYYSSSIAIYLKLPQINSNLVLKNTFPVGIKKSEIDKKEPTFEFQVLSSSGRYVDGQKIIDYFRDNPHKDIVLSNELETINVESVVDYTVEDFVTKMSHSAKEHVLACYSSDFYKKDKMWNSLVNDKKVLKEIFINIEDIKDRIIKATNTNSTIEKVFGDYQNQNKTYWSESVTEANSIRLKSLLDNSLTKVNSATKKSKV